MKTDWFSYDDDDGWILMAQSQQRVKSATGFFCVRHVSNISRKRPWLEEMFSRALSVSYNKILLY